MNDYTSFWTFRLFYPFFGSSNADFVSKFNHNLPLLDLVSIVLGGRKIRFFNSWSAFGDFKSKFSNFLCRLASSNFALSESFRAVRFLDFLITDYSSKSSTFASSSSIAINNFCGSLVEFKSSIILFASLNVYLPSLITLKCDFPMLNIGLFTSEFFSYFSPYSLSSEDFWESSDRLKGFL